VVCLAAGYLEEGAERYQYRYAILCGGEAARARSRTSGSKTTFARSGRGCLPRHLSRNDDSICDPPRAPHRDQGRRVDAAPMGDVSMP
jgi:hypothetical protein